MDKQLIKNLLNAKLVRTPERDGEACPGEKVNMYTVEGDTLICKVWNSSNNSGFDKEYVAKEIVEQLIEDEDTCEGRVNYNFNEIMFEISEK